MQNPLTCRQMTANFMRDELVVGWTSSKVKIDALSIIRKNKLNTQGENWNPNSQVQSFCIEYIVAALPSVK